MVRGSGCLGEDSLTPNGGLEKRGCRQRHGSFWIHDDCSSVMYLCAFSGHAGRACFPLGEHGLDDPCLHIGW